MSRQGVVQRFEKGNDLEFVARGREEKKRRCICYTEKFLSCKIIKKKTKKKQPPH